VINIINTQLPMMMKSYSKSLQYTTN